jgi:hypothetical protein
MVERGEEIMSSRAMTMEDIRSAGIRALERELGPAGMLRFLLQFERGRGDYSDERREWLDTADAETWAERIRTNIGRRKKSKK